MPTPSAEFLQAIDTPADEGCYELPKSLDEEFSSYSSAVLLFLSESADFISSAEVCAEATLFPAVQFCEGSSPNDRDAASGLSMSMGAMSGALIFAVLAS